MSSGGAVRDDGKVYDVPARLRLDRWAIAGDWTIGPQAAVSNEAGIDAYVFTFG